MMEADLAIEVTAMPIAAAAVPMAAPAPKAPMPVEPTLAPLMIPATSAGSLSTSMNKVMMVTRSTPISEPRISPPLLIWVTPSWMMLWPIPMRRVIVMSEAPMPRTVLK